MSATNVDRIKAGLAARGHKTNFKSLANAQGAPLTFKALNETLAGVLERRNALKATATKHAERVAAYTERQRAELKETGIVREDLGTGRGSHVQDLWGDDKRKVELDKRVNVFRREQLTAGQEGRDGAMKFIREALGKVDQVRAYWSDPVALLHRQTLGESGRRIYRQNMEGARPAALEAAITEATLTNNRPMLAAALDVLDSMDADTAKHVNVSRTEAAAMVLGDDYVKACQHLAALDLGLLEAEQAVADMEGNRTNATKLRKIGLLKRELQALNGEIDFEELEAELLGDEGGSDE